MMKLELADLASIAEVIAAVAIAVQSWYQMMAGDEAGIEAWLNSSLSAKPRPRNGEFRYSTQQQSLLYAM